MYTVRILFYIQNILMLVLMNIINNSFYRNHDEKRGDGEFVGYVHPICTCWYAIISIIMQSSCTLIHTYAYIINAC